MRRYVPIFPLILCASPLLWAQDEPKSFHDRIRQAREAVGASRDAVPLQQSLALQEYLGKVKSEASRDLLDELVRDNLTTSKVAKVLGRVDQGLTAASIGWKVVEGARRGGASGAIREGTRAAFVEGCALGTEWVAEKFGAGMGVAVGGPVGGAIGTFVGGMVGAKLGELACGAAYDRYLDEYVSDLSRRGVGWVRDWWDRSGRDSNDRRIGRADPAIAMADLDHAEARLEAMRERSAGTWTEVQEVEEQPEHPLPLPSSLERSRDAEPDQESNEEARERIEQLWLLAGAYARSLESSARAARERSEEEQIRRERQRGLVCSECGRTPTQIRREEGEEFRVHLARVRGVAVESGR